MYFKIIQNCICNSFKGTQAFEAEMCEKSQTEKNKGVVNVHENQNNPES